MKQVLIISFLAMALWFSSTSPGKALDWETNANYRSAALQTGPDHKPGFLLLNPQQTGLVFTNVAGPSRYTTNQIYLNGSGVAAGDVDGDGWCDLFFCSLDGSCALFR